MILFLLLFFVLQALVLFCCLAAGNDAASQIISDQEQVEFLQKWMHRLMHWYSDNFFWHKLKILL